jgi:hypothetical protein
MRPHYVPAPHFFQLNHACHLVAQAFDNVGVYLVGSSLERRDFRDVDVRMIMHDEEYDRWFKDEGDMTWLNPRWSLLCTTISLWLSQTTGLPIDFQIQRMTQANETYDGKRNALGLFMDYPGERPSDIDQGD